MQLLLKTNPNVDVNHYYKFIQWKTAKQKVVPTTLMSIAIHANNVIAVNILLNHGYGIENGNGRPTTGMTPLLIALRLNRLSIAFYLIDCGANVNAVTKRGTTVLHESLSNTSFAISQKLLSSGADCNIENITSGLTPIMTCMKRRTNAYSKIEYMIKSCKMDINLANSQGITPLLYAIQLKRVEDIKTMIDLGTDLKYTYKGKTCLEYIKEDSSLYKNVLSSIPIENND